MTLLFCLATTGCRRAQTAATPDDTPEVVVSRPVVKEITDYEDFTGRTEAVASVEVRARVTGYLDKVLFKEGTEVKQGDPLFEIDSRAYQIELRRAEAALRQAESQRTRLQRDYQQASPRLASQAIGQDEFDRIANDRDDAEVSVRLAEAARDLARLNMTFTQVVAPISGRISRQLIDPGNLVKADETSLTTIVAVDPIYVYFDEDERTMLRIRRTILAGRAKAGQETSLPVLMGLVDEEGFLHEGRVNFIDNRVDSATGTLRMRGIFPNPQGLLAPGLFARIRVQIGASHTAVLISEQALGNDQGQRFVYIVNDRNEVEYRRVKAGTLQEGLRAIDEGLTPKDRVVLGGPQGVRPGVKVEPKLAKALPATPAQAQLPAQVY